MTLCDYDSSSDSDSSTASSCLSDGNSRYPHHTGTPHNHTSKKRNWSETDDESDLPGVPDYYHKVSSSHARFCCYDSDSDEFEDSREIKRRRTGNDGKPVVPIAGGVRDLLVKCPTPAPRPTSAFPVSIIRKPSRRLGSGFKLDENLEYLTLDSDPSPQNGSEFEPILVAVRPQAQTRPFVHTYPAPKPTTSLKVRMIKASSPVDVEPKPAVLKSAWLGVTSNWSFPSL